MNLLIEEIKKITNRKQFWIIAILLFGCVFADFLITCAYYYGKPLSSVPSAYRCIIIYNYVRTPVAQIFDTFFLPLAASIIASDIYYEEKTLGINNFIFTRVLKRDYLWSKIWSIVIVVFSLVTIPILVNIVLSLSAFPLQGHYTATVPYKMIMEPDQNSVLSYLEAYHPYWNIIAFACLRGVFAAVSAVLAFSVSFLQKANRYFLVLSSMLFYILYTLITYFIGLIPTLEERISQVISTGILRINPYGSIWVIVFYLLLELLISAVLIRKGMKSSDEC